MPRSFRLLGIKRHELGVLIAVRIHLYDALDGCADVQRADGEPRVSGLVVHVVERHAAAEHGEPRIDAVHVTAHCRESKTLTSPPTVGKAKH